MLSLTGKSIGRTNGTKLFCREDVMRLVHRLRRHRVKDTTGQMLTSLPWASGRRKPLATVARMSAGASTASHHLSRAFFRNLCLCQRFQELSDAGNGNRRLMHLAMASDQRGIEGQEIERHDTYPPENAAIGKPFISHAASSSLWTMSSSHEVYRSSVVEPGQSRRFVQQQLRS